MPTTKPTTTPPFSALRPPRPSCRFHAVSCSQLQAACRPPNPSYYVHAASCSFLLQPTPQTWSPASRVMPQCDSRGASAEAAMPRHAGSKCSARRPKHHATHATPRATRNTPRYASSGFSGLGAASPGSGLAYMDADSGRSLGRPTGLSSGSAMGGGGPRLAPGADPGLPLGAEPGRAGAEPEAAAKEAAASSVGRGAVGKATSDCDWGGVRGAVGADSPSPAASGCCGFEVLTSGWPDAATGWLAF